MWVLFVVEAVAIVTGNVAVLVVFTRTPSLRKRKHYLLISLALTDLLVGMISVPMYVAPYFVDYSSAMLTVYRIRDPLLGTASVFGLTAVAIERAYAVYFPFKHRTLRKSTYVIGIAVTWLLALVPTFSKLYFDRLWRQFSVTAPIIVSLVVIIISYFLIWIKIKCSTNVQGQGINGRQKRLTVTLLIVTVISLVAWIPIQALMVYVRLCNYPCLDKDVFGTTKFLHYGNSLVNPIVYALRMPHFKRALLNAVRCCMNCGFAQLPDNSITLNQLRINQSFTVDRSYRDGCEDGIELNDQKHQRRIC